jgi:peptide/nickel transport system substrate-binding protein
MKLGKTFAILVLMGVLTLGLLSPAWAQSRNANSLVIAEFEEPDTLDPNVTGMIESLRILEFITEPLVTLDKQLEPVALLAQSWEWSEDEKEITFTLKEGIQFHDGTLLNTEAVRLSLDRFKNLSSMAYMLDAVEEIIIHDERTFSLKLKEKVPNLLYNLADGHISILSPKMLAERTDEEIGKQVLIGTGPYKLSQWIHGDRLILEKFTGYQHGPDFIGNVGPAYMDEIVFRIIPEGSVRVAELVSGEVDLTWNVPTVSVDRLQSEPGINLEIAPTYSVQYLAPNSARSGLDDDAVRVAIALAIDKQALLNVAWDGIGAVAYGPINEAIIGYWDGVETLGYSYKPDQAKELLEKTGWIDSNGDGVREKDGTELTFTLLTATAPESRVRGATMVQQMLSKVGIKVGIETLEFGTAFSKAKEGNHDMVIFGNTWWFGPDFLKYTNYSALPTNFGRITNQLLDFFLDKSVSATSYENMQQAMAKVQALILEGAGFIPLVSEAQIIAATSEVKGLDQLVTHPWWPSLMKALVLDK